VRPVRVLVTGASGQVGSELVAHLSSRRARLEVLGVSSAHVDVGSREAVNEVFDQFRPSIAFHLAAMTQVDACESEAERAFRVNAWGTRNVVAAAEAVGARVVYVSTDYVFDGTSDRPYHEWDPPKPINVYGASKLGGEMELRPEDACVRISWVSGAHGNNIVRTVLKLLAQGQELSFVTDQVGCPTFTFDLAPVLALIGLEGLSGIFHVTNQGPTSWYGFAREIAAQSGAEPDRIKPVLTKDLVPPRPARRPANSVLANTAIKFAGIDPLPDWRESLPRLLAEIGPVPAA
jgi:dTDP-4-dehydrorhamnose reductase